jgi:hypothetical protein
LNVRLRLAQKNMQILQTNEIKELPLAGSKHSKINFVSNVCFILTQIRLEMLNVFAL